MAVGNPIQFAVVREDPEVELSLIDRAPRGDDGRCQALLVASGGCTALTIAARRSDVAILALDPNRAQLNLVERKLAALRAHGVGTRGRAEAFGVGRDDETSLTGCGNFESLFRGLRAVLDDLVMPHAERERLVAHRLSLAPLVEKKYWPVAFQLFFSDPFLEAMFGPDATQHAARGSYPAYFQRAFETGLNRPDAHQNYFLHHALLGYYCDDKSAWPDYLRREVGTPIEFLHAAMADAPSFSRFGLISLSNIFDWMAPAACEAIIHRLAHECRRGTVVVVRQLNNRRPIEESFGPAFRFDRQTADRLLEQDRSLFYERIVVAVKSDGE